VPVERCAALAQHVTDDLVDGVVPPHVFPHGDKQTGQVEQRGGVEAARLLKGRLGRRKRGPERVQGLQRYRRVCGNGDEIRVECLERGLAADSAGGGREE
jgi:hypothetical protein